MNLRSLINLYLIFAASIALVGCTTAPTPASIETKAWAVTRGVARAVLANNPGNAELRDGMRIAAEDLNVLAAAEQFDLAALLAIVDRLPAGAIGNGAEAFYIETGLLFFSDELGAVAVRNPEMGRAAARGMARGIEQILALGL